MREETARKIASALGYPAVDTDRDPTGFVHVIAQEGVSVQIDISEALVSSINGACGFGLDGEKLIANLVALIEGEVTEYSCVCKTHGRVVISDYSPFRSETRPASEKVVAEADYHREHCGDESARAECRPRGPEFEWEPLQDAVAAAWDAAGWPEGDLE